MNVNEFYKRILTSITILPLSIFFIMYNKISFLLFLIFIAIISIFEWYKIYHKKDFFFIIGIFFLILSFLSAILLRGNNLQTISFFLWVILICVFSDIGGYIFGNVFGGKKLTKISPSKTVAGSAGSFLLSFIPLFLLEKLNIFYLSSIEINIKYLTLNLFFCFICQLGDICVSYFKRKNNIKNISNILPGHGGILDRIDGILFVIPVAYLIKYFEII